jgi:hypothetical protein
MDVGAGCLSQLSHLYVVVVASYLSSVCLFIFVISMGRHSVVLLKHFQLGLVDFTNFISDIVPNFLRL